ncbi:porin family protein [Flavobacteriaceae bacterium]|nr:porin family protein [Flavobacteriaceae bacterium]
MKKVLLFAAFAAFAMTSVNAQDDSSGFAKSDIYMTGTVGFNSSTESSNITGDTDTDNSSTTFSPAIGYMLTDNIALEAGLSYSSTDGFDEESELDAETTITTFSVGARWFMNPTDKFSLSVGAGLGFGSGTRSYTGTTFEGERSAMTFTVAPAVNYWISDSWGLFANIAAFEYASVTDSNNQDSDEYDTTSTGLNIDLTDINFGMVYKF